MTLSRREVFEKLKSNEEEIQNFGAERIGVFGSHARGENTEDSDLDLLVEFKSDEKTYRNFIGLEDFLNELFPIEVDLVTEKGLKNSIKQEVLEEVKYA